MHPAHRSRGLVRSRACARWQPVRGGAQRDREESREHPPQPNPDLRQDSPAILAVDGCLGKAPRLLRALFTAPSSPRLLSAPSSPRLLLPCLLLRAFFLRAFFSAPSSPRFFPALLLSALSYSPLLLFLFPSPLPRFPIPPPLLPTPFSQLPPPNWPTRPPPFLVNYWLAPTPPSSRWEGGVGGSLAPDLALIGGGRGGQVFRVEPGSSAIQTHPRTRPPGRPGTRPGADDLPDEALNHPADDPANHPPHHFSRLDAGSGSGLLARA